MEFRKVDNCYYVYVQKDEPVLETLTDFCKDHGIQNGQVFGIGAIKDVELGAYDLDTKHYTRQLFEGSWELIGMQANITQLDNEPFIHAHVTIGDHDFNVKGGHLFAGNVAVVGEFIIVPLSGDARRESNPEIGLATWKL